MYTLYIIYMKRLKKGISPSGAHACFVYVILTARHRYAPDKSWKVSSTRTDEARLANAQMNALKIQVPEPAQLDKCL